MAEDIAGPDDGEGRGGAEEAGATDVSSGEGSAVPAVPGASSAASSPPPSAASSAAPSAAPSAAADTSTGSSSGTRPQTRAPRPEPEAIDLLDIAGAPVAKRVAPVAGGLVVLALLWWLIRRR